MPKPMPRTAAAVRRARNGAMPLETADDPNALAGRRVLVMGLGLLGGGCCCREIRGGARSWGKSP